MRQKFAGWGNKVYMLAWLCLIWTMIIPAWLIFGHPDPTIERDHLATK